MQKRKRNLGYILITLIFLILLAFLLWYFLSANNQNPDFNQLKEWIATGQISDKAITRVEWREGFTLGGNRLSGTFYLEGGERYQFAMDLNSDYWKDLYTLLKGEVGPGGKLLFKNVSEIFQNKLPISYNLNARTVWTRLIEVLPAIVMILLFAGLGFFLLRRMQSSTGGGGINPFSMGKSKARQTESKIRFSDVGGIQEEKQELVEIVDYLKNPTRYSQMGARTPKGVLLEGPPGTGKTLLAKAVAGEAGVPFYSISGSEFEEMFVGVGASRVRELFSNAKKNAPCIIFIDEIDAVGRKRAGTSGQGASEQTLNQLLVEMDGFDTNAGVIIIAATNRVDVLDSALLRPGRFDRTIQLSLPDIKEREAILRLHARNKNLSPKIAFHRIAERTPGFSGAQLENVLNEATLLAVRKRKNIIDITDIDEAIDRVIGGPAKKSRVMTPSDKSVVSYHEAGHAVVGLKLRHASKVQKVTIIPRGNAGGYTIMTPRDESFLQSRENLLAMISGFLGGRAAEEIIFGEEKITTGAHDDFSKASNIAWKMVTQFGMSDLGLRQYEDPSDQYAAMKKNFSDDIAQRIDEEVNKILDEAYSKAKEIINEHRHILELISESLNVLETITSEQIEYIDEHEKLPEEVVEAKKNAAEFKEKEQRGDVIEAKPELLQDDETEGKEK